MAVAPCTEAGGTAYAPYMVQDDVFVPLSSQQLGELYAWGFSIVMVSFLVGYVVGSILKLLSDR